MAMLKSITYAMNKKKKMDEATIVNFIKVIDLLIKVVVFCFCRQISFISAGAV